MFNGKKIKIDKTFLFFLIFLSDSLEKLTNDWEIQNWAEELARSKEDGGIGLSVRKTIALWLM